MSWMCSSTTNQGLINNLFRYGLIKTPFIKEAMTRVDRKSYLRLSETLSEAYADVPLPLNNSVTISAPHIHAMALEYLVEQFKKPDCVCLDVGSGSGYLMACMLESILCYEAERDGRAPSEAHVLLEEEPRVRVVGVEYIEEIAEHSKRALRTDLERIEGGNPSIHKMYHVEHGDGWKGFPEYAPFHAIHVGAAAAEIPQKLVDQLAPGGRMVIPVGKYVQHLCLVDKDMNGEVSVKRVTEVRYVPLINDDKQPEFSGYKASSEPYY